MGDGVQTSLLDLIEEAERIEREQDRKSEEANKLAVRQFHFGTKKSIEDYITRMENIEEFYDLRDDELLEESDVIGECFVCGKEISVHDAKVVNAFWWKWKHRNGNYFNAYCCHKKHVGVLEPENIHKYHLKLCGLTEEEYMERLKKEQPDFYNRIYGSEKK